MKTTDTAYCLRVNRRHVLGVLGASAVLPAAVGVTEAQGTVALQAEYALELGPARLVRRNGDLIADAIRRGGNTAILA